VKLDEAELEATYRELISWCDIMHALADFLPCHIDAHVCERICAELVPLVDRSHAQEEVILFPRMVACYGCETAAEIAIARRRRDHFHDRDAARNVVNLVDELHTSETGLRWESVAYALRAFEQQMRRHIAAETELLSLLKRKAAHNRDTTVVDLSDIRQQR
jgi:hemerythrin-like domain-containing protein